jgi:hypothetical protein
VSLSLLGAGASGCRCDRSDSPAAPRPIAEERVENRHYRLKGDAHTRVRDLFAVDASSD